MSDETRTSTPVDEAPGEPPEEHTHRWRIEAQHGPESSGRCACGEVRQFANSYTSEQTNNYRRGQRRG